MRKTTIQREQIQSKRSSSSMCIAIQDSRSTFFIPPKFSRSVPSCGSPHRPACSLPMPFEGMNRRATPLFSDRGVHKKDSSHQGVPHPSLSDAIRRKSTRPIRSPHSRFAGNSGWAAPPLPSRTAPTRQHNASKTKFYEKQHTHLGPSVLSPSRHFGMNRRAFPPYVAGNRK